ncbi:DUF4190 domain-containing protein [Blastococcus sp. URHD0036]|uniref:DUF4190 domain-containing protein n=1 Tax=Blastococcus sp. URHD0036 TaxID=1380356 RepID=UPI0004986469|nr:DUF4190 domain-containing protein [Blastococcus sp. URHD0036]
MSSDGDFYRGDPPPAGSGQPYGQPAAYGAPGYGPPPAYGPPAYGPPAYGPPPGYGPGYPPGYGYARPTNTMAILALVFIFVFSPASLVLGLIARRQIRETGEQGDGMALAGVIVGGISVGLFVIGILFFVVAATSLSVSP